MVLFNGSAQWGHIICGVKILKHNAVYTDLKLNTANFYMQGKQKTCRYLFLNEFIDPIRFRWKREGNIISRVANM